MERLWLYGQGLILRILNPPSATSSNKRVLLRGALGAGGMDLLAILTLLAAAFGIYGRTLDFGYIIVDDPGYVYENVFVRNGLTWAGFRWALTAFDQANWHPLTWLSLMADAQFYGLNPGGYHLTNLLLHSVNAALIFLWLRRTTDAFWPSALTALFFVIHPLHVESVAWIAERKDVLSMFFCCLTLMAYTRYARRGGAGFYALSAMLYALGLSAKPMLVTLPGLLLLLDFWPLRRLDADWRNFWHLALEKTPFVLLAAGSCAVTLAAQHRGEAVVPLEALPATQRLTTAITAYGAYLGKTFWPVNLGIYYPYQSHQPGWLVASCSALLLAIGGVAWQARRKAPYLTMGWLWFLGTLVPVIGLVQVGGQSMADRYAYLPHVGLFMAICWAGAEGWRRWPGIRPWIGSGAALGVAGCLLLGCRQADYWRDSPTLFAHAAAISPPSKTLYNFLGDAYMGRRRFSEAENAYRQGLRLPPGSTPDGLRRLGDLQLAQGRWPEAVAALTQADALRPNDASTLARLGRALSGAGRPEEAADVYLRCLRDHPDCADARLGWADLLLAHGQDAEAATQFEKTLSRNPDCLSALTRFAWLLAIGGKDGALRDSARALALAQRAVALTHDQEVNSLDALAAAVASAGRWNQAAEVAQAALIVSQQPGAPAISIEIRRERLELYRAGQWPRR